MTALIVVDIQNDFLPGGSLAVPGGDAIIPLVNELMPEYDLVVATQDWHPDDHGSFATNHPGKNPGETTDLAGLTQVLWPVHCVQATPGASFPETLQHQRFDHVVRKGTDPQIDSYSGFHDNGHRQPTGLAHLLRDNGVTAVHIVGLATDYCVKFTALDAVNEGFSTTLITDATRGVDLTPGDIDRALAEMQTAGVTLTTSDQLLSDTVTLYRPVGPEELALLEAADFNAWPPRLPDQPIFYPVTNAAYAETIARDWNIPASGSAAITRFQMKRSFLRAFERKIVGARQHEEYWIPADQLDALNQNIEGPIEVITTIGAPIP